MPVNTIEARGQITIVDQNDATFFQVVLNSNQPATQIYTPDNSGYNPNWQTTNLVITPELFISSLSETGDVIANGYITNTKWTENGNALVTGGNYVVGATQPFALTVKNNVIPQGGMVVYQFSGTFTDPATTLPVNFKVGITYTSIQNTTSGILAQLFTPQGNVFKNAMIASLPIHCTIYRGSTEEAASGFSYKWGNQVPGVFAPTTASAAAATGQKNVTFASVTNVAPGGVGIGSQVKIGSATYVVAAVNTTTKVVTMTANITTAIASGAAITCPLYDADLGVNWALINSSVGNDMGITGFTTNEIVVPDEAVLSLEQFKCVATDIGGSGSPTNGQKVFDITTLTDFSDPIIIDILAPQGTTIKNGVGSVTLTAKVWQAGTEIDAAGTKYTYNWNKYDKLGNVIGDWKTGKIITVQATDIDVKSTFEMELIGQE